MKKDDAFAPLRRLLKGYDLGEGPQLAKVLGCSSPTAKARVDDPSRLTLGELRDICVRGGVPADEIRAAIRLGW